MTNHQRGFFVRFHRGQSVMEYTILIVTVVAAFIAMNVYMRRAVNHRLHTIELEANPGVQIVNQ